MKNAFVHQKIIFIVIWIFYMDLGLGNFFLISSSKLIVARFSPTDGFFYNILAELFSRSTESWSIHIHLRLTLR